MYSEPVYTVAGRLDRADGKRMHTFIYSVRWYLFEGALLSEKLLVPLKPPLASV